MVPETPPSLYPGDTTVSLAFPFIHNNLEPPVSTMPLTRTELEGTSARPVTSTAQEPLAETFLSKLKRLMFGDPEKTRRYCRPKTKTYQFGWCFLAVLFIFIISTFGCIIMWFTDLYLSSILNQMILKEDSEVFEAWRDPPVKPLICVHIFNYTNIDEFLADQRTMIKIQDTGPYCYRETLKKVDVRFYDNGTVSYGDRRTHVFEERNSTGSQDDVLVIPNFPFIGAVAMAEKAGILYRLGLIAGASYRKEKPMITFSAHKLIFGYEEIPKYIRDLSKIFGNEIPIEKIGILSMRATETKERITVFTGSEDLNTMGVVEGLNGNKQLTAWDEDECNRLDGSDGAFFPRQDINESAVLHLFHKDMCRKLPLVYQREVDFQDGVMGMRFHVPPNVYNTTGTCYCKDGVCPPAGVFDVSPCADGVSVMMSFPHFLNADPSVYAHLDGLHPDPEKHDFFIDVQPLLGFTLGTVARIQLNIQIRKSGLSFFKEFEDGTILPIAWFEVTADRLPPDLFKMIYHASVTVQWIQWGLQWGFLTVFILSSCCLLYLARQRQQPAEYNKPSEQFLATEIVTCRVTSL